jgi:ABC-2 type transport system ATP-binding protein
VFGFLGANGAGKTTTMRIALGVLEPDAGRVTWRGTESHRLPRSTWGYLPEERGLYPAMAVRDHLVYLGRLRGLAKARAQRATDRLMEAFGITALADRRIDSLSLGNAQRVQLASALVHDPVLVVLDEPFNGLDPLAAEQLAGLLRERVADGSTVLFSSHQLDTVERLCDTVVVLHDGRCVLSGSLAEVTGPDASLLEAFRRAVATAHEGDDA